jgi:4-aminobutyrate aminotransferase
MYLTVNKSGISMAKVPNIKVEPPGPEAKKVVAKDAEYIVKATKTAPLVFKKAEGAVIEDVDGNSYIDFYAGVGVLNVGARHPKVVAAIKDQVDKYTHVAGTDFYCGLQTRLAERLARSAPGKNKKMVFFSNTGAESVEAAIKIAKRGTGKQVLLDFLGAFHGRTVGAMSLTASKWVQREGYTATLMPGVYHVPYAYCYRCAYKMTYPECGMWCAKIIEEVYFENQIPPNDLAAISMEVVQGEGGYVVPPKEFVKMIHDLTRKYKCLLIDDEVQSGMGRTGKLWAVEHFDVVPDIICSAKSLGGGLPIAATIVDAKLDFDRYGRHSNTFGGASLAHASALATLDVIEEERLLDRATKVGKETKKRLTEMQEKYEIIGDTRGVGMMNAHEFVQDRKSKKHAAKSRDKIAEMAFKKGLMLLPCGKSVLRYIPPLNIPQDQLDAGLEILEDCIKAVDKNRAD